AAEDDFMPPCGHIAGIYRRTDYQVGVHKAPANEIIEGVLDLELQLTNQEQARLNPAGINCLRSRPGRGIRVWGARTLSVDASWVFINTRRLLFKLSRWIELNLHNVTFELHTQQLWTFIENELTVYLNSLVEAGQLLDFYVKCDEETNPKAERNQGKVMTEIGLAPAIPAEFIVVRVMHGESGITITG
ncbi:MAG: phage tail sheath family protein, partial [Chloroflexi bacterium]